MNLALFILWPPRCVQLQLIDTQSQVNKMTSVRLPSTCSRPGLCCEGLFFNLHGSLKSSPPLFVLLFSFLFMHKKVLLCRSTVPLWVAVEMKAEAGLGHIAEKFSAGLQHVALLHSQDSTTCLLLKTRYS